MSETGEVRYSDDGMYWWDGDAWQPVEGASGEAATAVDTSAGGTEGSADGLPALDGPIRLFTPAGDTTIVAIFAHGVDTGDLIDPTGATLGYYSPHGDPLDANITWAAGDPTHAPQKEEGDPTGQWPSYTLSTIGLGEKQQAELADTAEEYKVAIAYVVEATSTASLVPQLQGLGYSDIRGVHCRAGLGADDEPVQFGEAITKTLAELVSEGWKDGADDPVTDETDLPEGEILILGTTYYTIESKAGDTYTIRPYAG